VVVVPPIKTTALFFTRTMSALLTVPGLLSNAEPLTLKADEEPPETLTAAGELMPETVIEADESVNLKAPSAV
jgi:hypothetical protein